MQRVHAVVVWVFFSGGVCWDSLKCLMEGGEGCLVRCVVFVFVSEGKGREGRLWNVYTW